MIKDALKLKEKEKEKEKEKDKKMKYVKKSSSRSSSRRHRKYSDSSERDHKSKRKDKSKERKRSYEKDKKESNYCLMQIQLNCGFSVYLGALRESRCKIHFVVILPDHSIFINGAGFESKIRIVSLCR